MTDPSTPTGPWGTCQQPSVYGSRWPCGNPLPCSNPEHREPDPSTPVPSDEAVELVAQAISEAQKTPDHKRSRQRAKKALAKVYAIDAPRLRGEAGALLAHARELLATKDAAAAEARAATLREMCDDEESVVVRVKRIDAQALVLGGLDYALAVSEGREQAGGSPMRLRVALRDALNAAHFNPEANE